MGDVPNIEGLPDPRKASEVSGNDSVDPEKFKKLLKVEDTDEAQKRNQRQKPKKQEEEEELDAAPKENLETPQTAFSSYLEKPKESDTIFKAQSGTAQPVSPLEGDAKSTPFTIFSPSKEPLTKSSLDLSEAPVKEAVSTTLPSEILSQKEDAKDVDTSFITPPEGQKPFTSTLSSPTAEEKKALLPPTKGEEPSLMKREDSHKEKGFKEKSSFTPSQTAQSAIESSSLLATDTPAYATLSPEMFDLFEKLIGLMMIQSSKGVTTTTITLSMPGSLFDKCEILLEHYDTAPNSFNIQLLGNPAAVTLFTANLQGLTTSFTQGNYPFQVNLKKPALSAAHRPLIRRKGKSDKKSS